jgi:hypothetical protein
MNASLNGPHVAPISLTDLDRTRRFSNERLTLGEPWFDNAAMGWIEWGNHYLHCDNLEGNLIRPMSEPPAA